VQEAKLTDNWHSCTKAATLPCKEQHCHWNALQMIVSTRESHEAWRRTSFQFALMRGPSLTPDWQPSNQFLSKSRTQICIDEPEIPTAKLITTNFADDSKSARSEGNQQNLLMRRFFPLCEYMCAWLLQRYKLHEFHFQVCPHFTHFTYQLSCNQPTVHNIGRAQKAYALFICTLYV
jgi:hypothetical protein